MPGGPRHPRGGGALFLYGLAVLPGRLAQSLGWPLFCPFRRFYIPIDGPIVIMFFRGLLDRFKFSELIYSTSCCLSWLLPVVILDEP